MEHMGFEVEVYPVAANDAGFRLLSGEHPWSTQDLVRADSRVHWEVLGRLAEHGLDGEDATQVPVIHSTSWRPHERYPRLVIVYVVAVNAGPDVIDRWPESAAISHRLLERHGAPVDFDPHGAAEEPIPRAMDVLFHGLRHYELIRTPLHGAYDPLTAMGIHSLPGPADGVSWWDVHLDGIRPAMVGLYIPLMDRLRAA